MLIKLLLKIKNLLKYFATNAIITLETFHIGDYLVWL